MLIQDNLIYYDHSENDNPLFAYAISLNPKADVNKVLFRLTYEIGEETSIIKYQDDNNKNYYFLQSKAEKQEIKINNDLSIYLETHTSAVLEQDGDKYKMVISPNYDNISYNFELKGDIKVTNKKDGDEITYQGNKFKVDVTKSRIIHD